MMKIILIDNELGQIEVFRLTPQEHEFLDDYDNYDLQEWERVEKILYDRGIETNMEEMFRYTCICCEEFPIYDEASDEPIFVIR